jgi:hypothetical protein
VFWSKKFRHELVARERIIEFFSFIIHPLETGSEQGIARGLVTGLGDGYDDMDTGRINPGNISPSSEIDWTMRL